MILPESFTLFIPVELQELFFSYITWFPPFSVALYEKGAIFDFNIATVWILSWSINNMKTKQKKNLTRLFFLLRCCRYTLQLQWGSKVPIVAATNRNIKKRERKKNNKKINFHFIVIVRLSSNHSQKWQWKDVLKFPTITFELSSWYYYADLSSTPFVCNFRITPRRQWRGMLDDSFTFSLLHH